MFLIGFPFLLFSQITRTGSFVANDPGVYPISGDIVITEDAGVLTVVFESNFQTVQGLALEVFLTDSKDLDVSTDVLISTAPLDQGTSPTTPITGMHMFTAPAGTSIFDFDNVIIQCTTINELWGHANFCDANLDVISNPIQTNRYVAESIRSSSVLDAMANVQFEALDNIELNSGFTVPQHAEFQSNVGASYGCNVE